MRQRLPLIFSAAALLIALFGATPLGRAAGRALHVVPYAAKAGFAQKASLAYEALRVNGHQASLKPLPNQIPVVGSDGKLPASIGAVGAAGPKGDKGDKGAKGDKGDKGATGLAGPAGPAGPSGISGYQLVTGTNGTTGSLFHSMTVQCPAGKKPLGGGGFVNGVNGGGPWLVATSDGTGWVVTSTKSSGSLGVVAYVICANVTS